MKSITHTLLSSAAGFGLAAFTLVSFALGGFAAPETAMGFSFLVVYGLCEMAFIDYTPLRASAGGRRTVPSLARFRAPAHPVGAETLRRAA